MTSSTRLQGTDLIECARANVKEGIEIAAQRCGYGNDFVSFEYELHQAGNAIGVTIYSFKDLLAMHQDFEKGVVIAPKTSTQL